MTENTKMKNLTELRKEFKSKIGHENEVIIVNYDLLLAVAQNNKCGRELDKYPLTKALDKENPPVKDIDLFSFKNDNFVGIDGAEVEFFDYDDISVALDCGLLQFGNDRGGLGGYELTNIALALYPNLK